MYLPVAHGEGRFVTRNESTLKSLECQQQLALRYAPLSDCAVSTGETSTTASNGQIDIDHPLQYPDNPNGAQANVAGMCDSTGHVFGLMPHPERHIDPTQHPRWTRGEAPEAGDGLRLFQNAVAFFR
jgi:phosphoribosylformylglycinamidine synthase